MQHVGTMIKLMISLCVRLVTPVDTSTEGDGSEKIVMHDSFTPGRLEGVCKVILCWAAAVCIGLLISRLH